MAPRSRSIRPVLTLVLAWTAALALGACRASEGEALSTRPAPPVVVERTASVLVLSTSLGPADTLVSPWFAPAPEGERLAGEALPVAVRRVDEGFACRRHEDGDPIHYLVFERAGEEAAYGVYGLVGPKNDLPTPLPLSGEAVEWDGVDHEAALRRHLGRVGVGAAELDALFEAHRDVWFREGLRVFFALDAEEAARLGAAGPAPRAALLRVELASE